MGPLLPEPARLLSDEAARTVDVLWGPCLRGTHVGGLRGGRSPNLTPCLPAAREAYEETGSWELPEIH